MGQEEMRLHLPRHRGQVRIRPGRIDVAIQPRLGPVVVPGNEQIGIWASPGLELVLPLTDARQPPTENGLRESQPTERELQSIE